MCTIQKCVPKFQIGHFTASVNAKQSLSFDAIDMADPRKTAEALSAELKSMANWLGLKNILLTNRGNLAKHLDLE